MLEARHLTVRIGDRPVLDDVNVRAARGEIVVVLGSEASGKSTLLAALAGRIVPHAGEVTIDGRASVPCDDLVTVDDPATDRESGRPFALLRRLDRLASSGKIVVVALRDLSLAAYFANTVVLLRGGRIVASGRPGSVLDADRLAGALALPCRMLRHA